MHMKWDSSENFSLSTSLKQVVKNGIGRTYCNWINTQSVPKCSFKIRIIKHFEITSKKYKDILGHLAFSLNSWKGLQLKKKSLMLSYSNWNVRFVLMRKLFLIHNWSNNSNTDKFKYTGTCILTRRQSLQKPWF